jgi:mannose-6-phosphate isomerase-like protein (cupin superfamily)
MKTTLAQVAAYVTKDGSEIRELMHPDAHGSSHVAHRQSLAEATLVPGQRTLLHRHALIEELYHVTAGSGLMVLGELRFEVTTGDTVCIPPGTPHCIANSGSLPLKVLCMCSPAYSHQDTELLAD